MKKSIYWCKYSGRSTDQKSSGYPGKNSSKIRKRISGPNENPAFSQLMGYDLPVLIYISVEDKNEIISYLQKHDFKYPFIHDPHAKFFEGNNILDRMNMDRENTVAALFVEGNEITDPAQIGMRH